MMMIEIYVYYISEEKRYNKRYIRVSVLYRAYDYIGGWLDRV